MLLKQSHPAEFVGAASRARTEKSKQTFFLSSPKGIPLRKKLLADTKCAEAQEVTLLCFNGRGRGQGKPGHYLEHSFLKVQNG